MLTLHIEGKEFWDESTNTFVYTQSKSFRIEHSLVSLSKWEAIWKKPFLESIEHMSSDEMASYIECMTIDQNVDKETFKYAARDPKVLKQIVDYMNDPMTATTFRDDKQHKEKEIITSEIMYYWITALNIPIECQKWHLNRFMTLVKVCSIKSNPDKKMSKQDIYARQKAINAERRAKSKAKMR